MHQRKRILIVDDEAPIRYVAARHLEAIGYLVAEACDGYQAKLLVRLAVENKVPIDLMLLDAHMLHLDQHQLFIDLVELDICPPFILMTSNGDTDDLELMEDPRCLGSIRIPFEDNLLRESVSRAFLVLNGHECRTSPLPEKKNSKEGN